MSDAIKELHDYLAESPSVVYPQDVLEYLPAIEAENAKLRDLALNCYRMAKVHCTDRDCYARCSHWPECYERDTIEHVEPCELSVIAQELGIEVDE